MAKVFSAVPGREFRVGHYGTAGETSAAEVPEDVARELEAETDRETGKRRFRVEGLTPAPKEKKPAPSKGQEE